MLGSNWLNNTQQLVWGGAILQQVTAVKHCVAWHDELWPPPGKESKPLT